MTKTNSENGLILLPDSEPLQKGTTNLPPDYYVGPEGSGEYLPGRETEGSGKDVLVPRAYQRDAEEAVEREWALGVPSTLIVIATGLGKTVIAANLIKRRLRAANRSLFLAHRTELLDQTLRKLDAVGVRGDLERASSYASLDARVVVASVQTLQGKRLARFPPDHFDVVVVDEAHHSPAFLYKRILNRFARAKGLGLTATPIRADGRSLGKIYHSVAYRKDIRAGIEEGWLAPLRVRRVWLDSLDLRDVAKQAGDFHVGQLEAVCSSPAVLRQMSTAIVELSARRPTLVFASSVSHAYRLASALRVLGRSAVALDGSTDSAERSAVIRDFEEGRIQYLVNCSLFVEGFDVPRVACVCVARPTMSLALYAQMVGRGERLFPGKVDNLVIDFLGASRHGLVGPLDVLASGSPLLEQMREEIEPLMLRGEVDLSTKLRDLEASAQQRLTRSDLLVTAAFRSREIDPYIGRYIPNTNPQGGPPIDEAMRKALYQVLGIEHPPPGLSMAEARTWIQAAYQRRKAGLCSVSQARKLANFGLDCSRMSCDRAIALFVQLRTHGWAASSVRFEPEYRG